MIYLDNAATSFPKPKEAVEQALHYIHNIGGNPGRSGHTLSLEAARIIFEAREHLAHLLHIKNSEHIIFTHNGTEALNLAILGLLKENDHVITTSLEHNSVMRPLTYLQKGKHIDLSIIQCSHKGELDIPKIKRQIKKKTKAVIINHGSNVIGTVQPLGEIKREIGDIILIADVCQTVGAVPINCETDNIDILCFSCHKSLYAFQGVGAMYIKEGIQLTPLRFGGTGSKSESIEQPDFLPDKYESGTPNTPGIASLLGGLTFIEHTGLLNIHHTEKEITKQLVNGLSSIHDVTLYGSHDRETGIPVVSFNIKGKLPSDVGYQLNKRNIYTRVGLHCSPMAHKTIGTFPHGTVRVSPGYFTTEEDIKIFLEAVQTIAVNNL